MAGDWIKMRPSLLTSPKVNGMARFLEDSPKVSRALSTGYSGPMSEIVSRNVMRNVTVASLLIVWSAANEHTTDGVFKNADLSDIDDMVGIPGFGEAMEFVGWAIFDAENGSVILPNFSEYNTCGKDRSAEKNAERQRKFREKQRSVTETSNGKSNVTNNVTNNDREEKRREEGKPPTSPIGEVSPPTNETLVTMGEGTASLPIVPADPQKTEPVAAKATAQGTRLPADWALPRSWGEWALSHASEQGHALSADAVRATAEKFRDFWVAKPGKDGRKADWEATWRNWIRRELERQPAAAPRRSIHDQRSATIAALTGQAGDADILEGELRVVG